MLRGFINFFNHSERGVTLVEMMVTVSILSVTSAIIYQGFILSFEHYNKGQRKAAVVQDARGAMELMSRSIREARSFSEATTNAVTYVQYDYDSNNDSSDDTIRLSIESIGGVNRVRKDVNSALERYLTDFDDNVNSLVFEYFSTNAALDTDGDGVANASEIDAGGNDNGSLDGSELSKINYVEISLNLEKTSGGKTSDTFLATSVYLRNIR